VGDANVNTACCSGAGLSTDRDAAEAGVDAALDVGDAGGTTVDDAAAVAGKVAAIPDDDA
jgi:hypothetical protein